MNAAAGEIKTQNNLPRASWKVEIESSKGIGETKKLLIYCRLIWLCVEPAMLFYIWIEREPLTIKVIVSERNVKTIKKRNEKLLQVASFLFSLSLFLLARLISVPYDYRHVLNGTKLKGAEDEERESCMHGPKRASWIDEISIG